MYQASVPRVAQDARLSGFSCMRHFVPNGASGVELKSNVPFNAAYAESFGLYRHGRRRFKVVSLCGRSRSHSLAGKLEGAVQRQEMKCALKVWIARSAMLRLCRCGGTSW